MNVQKIVVTGSEGTIGKIVVDELKKQGHIVVSIDRDAPNSINILKDNIDGLFEGVETIIHLAANPSPEISEEVAQTNLELVRRVLEASKTNAMLQRIINASSIHVYPYVDMYNNHETITRATPLSPNLFWKPAAYARAKIEAEAMVNSFCAEHNLASIQLRFGHVSEENLPTQIETEWKNDLEQKTFLYHDDLRKIINSSITLDGMHQYLCISNTSWFIDDNIVFLLK